MATRREKAAVIVAAMVLAAPVAVAERPACPTGETDGWRWQVNATYMQLVNDTLEVDWDTAGVDKTSTGMEITLSLSLDSVVQSISFNFAPLGFHITQTREGADDWKVSLFERFERGQSYKEVEFRPTQHNFVGSGYDASSGELKALFNSRVEQWETDEYEVAIKWNGFDHAVDWTFSDLAALRLGLSTTHFSAYGAQQSWALVGLSGPLDLTVLKPVIADARAAQDAMTGNRMCNMDYKFGL